MKCPKCGDEFTPTTKHGYTTKTCSRSCASTKPARSESNKLRSEANKMWYKNNTDLARTRQLQAIQTCKEKRKNKIEHGDFYTLSGELKREKILFEQNQKCDICGCDQEWNSMPLKFQLDHINGDRINNTRENLRMICPNCHTQTPTYGIKAICVSDEVLIESLLTSPSLYTGLLNAGLQPTGGNYKRARILLEKIESRV